MRRWLVTGALLVVLLIAALDLGILLVVGCAGLGGFSTGEATVSTLSLLLGFGRAGLAF